MRTEWYDNSGFAEIAYYDAPKYTDGQEIREGDVCLYGGEYVVTIEGIRQPTGGVDYKTNGDNRHGFSWPSFFTLLRRENEFKVGDVVRVVDNPQFFSAGKERTVGLLGNDEQVKFKYGGWISAQFLTLIKPVEDIECEGGALKKTMFTGEAETREESQARPWLARAERKEFLEGDVCVGLTSGKIRTVLRVDAPNWFQTADETGCQMAGHSLLRPVDWKPEVGDRVVLLRHSFHPVGHVLTAGKGFNTELHGGFWSRWGKHCAPAELAEPLIPLLRGDAESAKSRVRDNSGIVASAKDAARKYRESCEKAAAAIEECVKSANPCPRHESTGCNGSIESGECPECGWPGLKAKFDRQVIVMGEERNADGTTMRTGYPMEWRNSGETIPEQQQRIRWTADLPQTRHCRKCGESRGCGCGVEFCS